MCFGALGRSVWRLLRDCYQRLRVCCQHAIYQLIVGSQYQNTVIDACQACKGFERVHHHGDTCDRLVLLRRGSACATAKTRAGNDRKKPSGDMGG